MPRNALVEYWKRRALQAEKDLRECEEQRDRLLAHRGQLAPAKVVALQEAV